MATIAKIQTATGAVKFKAIIKQNGKILKSKTFTRKTDAKTWASRIEADQEKMEALGIPGANLTFSELGDEYLRQWTGRDRNQAIRLRFWKAHLGSIKLADISVTTIRDVLHSLEKGKCLRGDGIGRSVEINKPRAAATINRYLCVLSSALKYAMGRGYITNNPAQRIPGKTLNNKVERYLSNDERERLLEACRQATWNKLYLLVLMAITTGMRKSELINLRWSDIDFDRKVAKLAKTKNGEPRHCPIPSVTMAELSTFREVGNGFVFPSPTLPNKPFDFKKQWLKALQTANIDNFRFHDLRHTAASYLVMGGASLYEAAAVLGHKSIQPK